jgi:hypothetical protein
MILKRQEAKLADQPLCFEYFASNPNKINILEKTGGGVTRVRQIAAHLPYWEPATEN